VHLVLDHVLQLLVVYGTKEDVRFERLPGDTCILVSYVYGGMRVFDVPEVTKSFPE